MATRKRHNPFIEFAGKFRKANKGKYDFKQMGREAGKAWRKVKGGMTPREKEAWEACKYTQQHVGDNDDTFNKNQAKCEDAAKNSKGYNTMDENPKARAITGYGRGGRSRRTQKRRR